MGLNITTTTTPQYTWRIKAESWVQQTQTQVKKAGCLWHLAQVPMQVLRLAEGNKTQTWSLLREKKQSTTLGSGVCGCTSALEPGLLNLSRKQSTSSPRTPFHFKFAGKKSAQTGQLSKILSYFVYSPTFTLCHPPCVAVSDCISLGFIHVPSETYMQTRVNFKFSVTCK